VPPVKRFGRAVLGGTFDHLHVGHESLLETAFQVGRVVAIGITTERYLDQHPKPDGGALQSFSVRRRALTAWLGKHHPNGRWSVVPIDDPFGGSVGPDVDALVVSADTIAGGRAVNSERKRWGRAPVPVVVVPLALADDLLPVASRRIRAGTIDRDGRRLAPIRVQLRTPNVSDRRVATKAIRDAFRKATVVLAVGRPTPEAELYLNVARVRGDGWKVAFRSDRVRLRPVSIPDPAPSALEQGLRALLRPERR
jgi:pantetheine-phosphate adenylyltransferase